MNDLRLFDPLAPDPIDDAFYALMRPWRSGSADLAPRIKLDLSEEDGSYLVKAEIPGVRKEDIDVRVDGGQVTISVNTKTGAKSGSTASLVMATNIWCNAPTEVSVATWCCRNRWTPLARRPATGMACCASTFHVSSRAAGDASWCVAADIGAPRSPRCRPTLEARMRHLANGRLAPTGAGLDVSDAVEHRPVATRELSRTLRIGVAS